MSFFFSVLTHRIVDFLLKINLRTFIKPVFTAEKVLYETLHYQYLL